MDKSKCNMSIKLFAGEIVRGYPGIEGLFSRGRFKGVVNVVVNFNYTRVPFQQVTSRSQVPTRTSPSTNYLTPCSAYPQVPG
jgi:hypothetical protein